MASIDRLPIPKGKITQFKNRGFETTEDLLKSPPLHVYDFTKKKTIQELKDQETSAIVGEIVDRVTKGHTVDFEIEDEVGDTVKVKMMGQAWRLSSFRVGSNVTVGGKFMIKPYYKGTINPPLFKHGDVSEIYLTYSKYKGLSEKYYLDTLNKALIYPLREHLGADFIQAFDLIPAVEIPKRLHFPKSIQEYQQATFRLLVEELFEFNFLLLADRNLSNQTIVKGIRRFKDTLAVKNALPFQLTKDQNEILRRLSYAFKHEEKVNALVQGDVGSGKTMIALFSMLMLAENGYSSILMAPTTVLARQHYEDLKEILEPLGYKTALLTGSMKSAERKKILAEIKSGNIHLVIGTHAVFSKDVEYKNLGLVIVDEEHRFGVEQRRAILEKADHGIHYIRLTATPIPRTLAQTIYGEEIQVYSLKTMPSGRKPIETKRVQGLHDGFNKIREEVFKGHQAYIVTPLIEANEVIPAHSVEEVYRMAEAYFAKDKIKIALAHGDMKPKEMQEILAQFESGEIDVLISTTIIEVGVNVPNATVILVVSADRFGLSQLHQLRGRVGRSSTQSYALLETEGEISEDAEEKIDTLVQTTDGFVISQKDMELRGTGNLLGIEQSGDFKVIQKILEHPDLNQKIRNEVERIKKDKEKLEHYRSYFGIENKEGGV